MRDASRSAPLVRLLSVLDEPSQLRAAAPLLTDRLAAVSRNHGLSALLFDALTRAEAVVPGHALLAQDARSIIATSMRIRRLTLELVDAFSSRGLRPVLLKGYALASRLYDAPLARPMTDVDIAVVPSDSRAAIELLEHRGFTRSAVPGETDPTEHHHHVPFHGPQGLVELHFRVTTGLGAVPLETADAQPVCVKLDDRDVLVPAPDVELTYLAFHAAQHLFGRLAWLLDLQRFIERYEADWDRVIAVARRHRMRRAVHASLMLASRALGARVPESVLDSLHVGRVSRRVLDQLFSDQNLEKGSLAQSRVAAFLARTLFTDSLSGAAEHLGRGFIRMARQVGSQVGQ